MSCHWSNENAQSCNLFAYLLCAQLYMCVCERTNERALCIQRVISTNGGCYPRLFISRHFHSDNIFVINSIPIRSCKCIYIDVVEANVHCNKSGDIFVTPNVETQTTHIQKKFHLLISYLLILFFSSISFIFFYDYFCSVS